MTAWIRARLCKLQKRVHSTHSLTSCLPMVSGSLTKTDRHDIVEILLKVALNTKNQIKSIISHDTQMNIYVEY